MDKANNSSKPATAATTPATLAQTASLEFEPWQQTAGHWQPPSDEEWTRLANPHLVTVRLAFRTMFKTKAEIIEMVSGMEEEMFRGLMDHLEGSADWFEGMTTIIGAARARLMCGVATVLIEDGLTDNDEEAVA